MGDFILEIKLISKQLVSCVSQSAIVQLDFREPSIISPFVFSVFQNGHLNLRSVVQEILW